MPDGFCRATPLNELYEKPPVIKMDPGTQPDLTIDRSAMWSAFKEAGVRALADTNRLTLDETKELFHTLALDRVIQLLLTSLAHLTTNS